MSDDYHHEAAPPGKLALFERALHGGTNTHTGIRDGTIERVIPISELLARFGADGLIRLRRADFEQSSLRRERFVTFNLGRVTNEVGKRYLVIAIASPGFKDDVVEVLPVLDPAGARVGLCTEVLQEVPIAEIDEACFRHSLGSIQDRTALKEALVERYRKFNEGLTPEQILSRGCAVTTIVF
jgi:hypothetical protein